jgi:hypothetical protein
LLNVKRVPLSPRTVDTSLEGLGYTLSGSITPVINPAFPTMILYPEKDTDCVTGAGGSPGKRDTRTVASTSIVMGYVPVVEVVPQMLAHPLAPPL